jgi:type IV pilus assembly protein PilV
VNSRFPHRNHPENGYSLIEVLVALFVLAVGLLGLAALQTTSFKFNSDSYARTQATLIAYEIIDRIRANPSGAYAVPNPAAVTSIKGTYEGCKDGGACDCDGGTQCNALNLSIHDLGKWYEEQARVLPDPAADPSTIELTGDLYTITIRWMERDLLMRQVWDVAI